MGKFYVFASDSQCRYRSYLCDLEAGKVVGEGAMPPVCTAADGAELYEMRENSTQSSSRLPREILRKIGFNIKPAPRERVDYWAYSKAKKEPVLAGSVHEMAGAAGGEQASPLGNYYRAWTTCNDHVLIDLKNLRMTTLPPAKIWMGGWWSNDEILFVAPNGDLMLYDVRTGQSEVLFSTQQLESFLASHGISLPPLKNYIIMSAWAGDHYEFFLAKSLYDKERSWLAKIDKEKRSPVLLDSSFPFARTGHLNGAATHYVFSGETETADSNAVYLYDRTTSQTLTLVPGAADQKYFSMPNFYGDWVIYRDGKSLRRMKLDGSDNRPVFPPASE